MTNARCTFIFAFLAVFSTALFAADVPERRLNNGNLILQGIPEIPAEIAGDLNRYQNVRGAGFLAWTEDGSGIYISTRFGDVNQIHRVRMPGGAREQLTFFSEPVSAVSRQNDGPLLTFSMDAGGSEFDQIFTLNPNSGEATMLSDGESRNGVVRWTRDGQRIAYQSTRRNGASNDIWTMDPDHPESAEIALESPDGTWWGPVEFNSGSDALLVVNYVSITDSRVHLLDLQSGSMTLLAGKASGSNDEAASTNIPYAFAAEDRGVFFVTDRFGEFNQLAYQDLSGGEPRILTQDIPWDIEGFAISDDRRRAAFIVNENGFSQLYLMDPIRFEYRRVESIPKGLVYGPTFSPDGKRLAMTLNTPRTPSDTFVLDIGDTVLDAGSLTRWTKSEVGGLDTDSFAEPELVRFESFDDRSIPAFVYKPQGDGPFPVIISIHGGPESQATPGFSSTVQLWIDNLGAAVIRPNVRGSDGYGKSYLALDNGFQREDSVRDIGALLDWIDEQDDLDGSRVAVFGGSYGGYMVLASAVHYSDRLRAAVDVVGISSFVTFLENTQDYRRDLRRVEYGDERDPAMRAHLEKISPLNNVEKIAIPMFVVQGQNDPRVPVTEAEQMVDALRESGRPVWYMNALNEGHGYGKKENRDVYQQAVVLFFREHLL